VIISIDFDETWTQDPEAWRTFARLLQRRGHTVIVTTNRYPLPLVAQEVYASVRTKAVRDIIFAGAKPKREAARERGYRVDVWVDDTPEMVLWGRHHPNPGLCVCRTWPGAQPERAHHRACRQARGRLGA
jgi:hypothetical protein